MIVIYRKKCNEFARVTTEEFNHTKQGTRKNINFKLLKEYCRCSLLLSTGKDGSDCFFNAHNWRLHIKFMQVHLGQMYSRPTIENGFLLHKSFADHF
jgi:hypothetical protein